jgi:hypothetical protein
VATHIQSHPPREGWEWLMKGVQLFKKKPGEMFLLGNSYLFVVLLFSLLIPHLGPVLVTLVTPGLGAGIFIAGKMASSGLRATPVQLFAGFLQNDKKHLQPLLVLGAMYSVCFALIKLIAFLALGAEPTQALTPADIEAGKIPDEAMEYMIAYSAIAGVLSIPVLLSFWFAPALIVWHDMSAPKALFASAVASWRNKGAFVIYGMGWLTISLSFSAFIMFVLGALGFPAGLLGALNLMTVAVVMAVSLCSFYPSYQAVFEADVVA